MNSVIETVKNFEGKISDLRSKQEHLVPEFSVYGEDCIHIDIPYIVETLRSFSESAETECLPHINNVIASLEKIQDITNTKNELIKKRNDVIDTQISNLRETLDTQISDVPEVSMDRAIRISKSKIEEKYIKVLNQVYLNLGFTHISKEQWRDKIYYNSTTQPKIRNEIINEFNNVCIEKNIELMQTISNFIQSESVSGGVLEVIKSRI